MNFGIFANLSFRYLVVAIFLIAATNWSNVHAQRATLPDLTEAEKIRDFEHLYKIMNEVNPYLWVNKRVKGIDWLSNYQEYRYKIQLTQSNEEFIRILYGIVQDLNTGHLDFLPTLQYPFYYDAYSQLAGSDSTYSGYVKELEKYEASQNYYYWGTLLNKVKREIESNISSASTPQTLTHAENVELTFLEEHNIGLLKVHSFGAQHIEQDEDTLLWFWKEIRSTDHLIIDIQGNGGGSTEYWKKLIVSQLIPDTLFYNYLYAFRNSPTIQYFRPQYEANRTKEYLIENGLKLPLELIQEDYHIRESQHYIKPEPSSLLYEGKIYLLIDDEVFSSSDTFAYFCKATDFATVVGKTSKGDGIGSDPFLLTLPESGIVLRYTGEMGLNPDGSANVETRTKPSIILDGKTAEDRLNNLLDRIIK